jgi:hypothetical protein
MGAVLAGAACAGGGGTGKPVVSFPGPAALQELEAKAVGKIDLGDEGSTFGDGFVLTGPLAIAGASPEKPSPFEALVSRAAAGPVRASLNCAARELGRFTLEKNKTPNHELRRHIVGACGDHAPEVAVGSVTADVKDLPAKFDEGELARHWADQLQSDVRRLVPSLSGMPVEVGASFVRNAERVLLIYVLAPRPAQLDQAVLVPGADGNVVIEGRVRVGAAFVSAYVNRGDHAVADCDVDLGVRLPRFRVTCAIAAEDPAAWLQIVYVRPQRVLGEPMVQMLIRRNDAAVATYRESALGGVTEVTSADEFTNALLQKLNAVRNEAGLDVVGPSVRQGESATRLAPYFFSAGQGTVPPEAADTVALGMLAGWNVTGMIRGGSFISTLVPNTRDVTRWLASALQTPMGRLVLMDPETRTLAVGPVISAKPDAVGAIVTGYSLYESSDHTADIVATWKRIIAARARKGVAAPKRLGAVGEIMKDVMSRVHAGEALPMGAADQVMQLAVDRYGLGMRGFVLEATSLDAITLPDELLSSASLSLEIGITHYKPPGGAWAQFVVVFVFADEDGGTETAARASSFR